MQCSIHYAQPISPDYTNNIMIYAGPLVLLLFHQIQYDELHDDEVDFPDELFVIPKSASDELTPDLLTPERERQGMKPAMSNDQKVQQKGKLK